MTVGSIWIRHGMAAHTTSSPDRIPSFFVLSYGLDCVVLGWSCVGSCWAEICCHSRIGGRRGLGCGLLKKRYSLELSYGIPPGCLSFAILIFGAVLFDLLCLFFSRIYSLRMLSCRALSR